MNDSELASLIIFLESGSLRDLSPMLSKNQVLKLLGEPDDVFYPYRNDHYLAELKYGSLHILFTGDQIEAITVEYRYDGYGLPPILEIGWYDVVKKMKVSDFKTLIKNAQLPCKQLVLPEGETHTLLVLNEPGVEILFGTRYPDLIDAISYSNTGPVNRPLAPC